MRWLLPLVFLLATVACGCESPAYAHVGGRAAAISRAGQQQVPSAGDPASIFGSNVYAWFRGDSLSLSGSNVNSATDKSGHSNDVAPTGSSPTYSATGGPNSTPIVTHTSGDALKNFSPTSVPLTGSSSNIFAVGKATSNNDGCLGMLQAASNGNSYICYIAAGTQVDMRHGPSGSGGGVTFTYGTSSFHNYALYTTTTNCLFDVDGINKDDKGACGTLPGDGSEIDVGISTLVGSWADVVFVKGTVTSTQVTQWNSYVHTRYGL